jgi:hypothetical protein
MIKAKVDNMGLLLFTKNKSGIWSKCHETCLPIYSDCEYFLCLPKHNEDGQCLHWLNGGNAQWSDHFHGWSDKDNYADDLESQEFFLVNAFMLNDNKFRIKPSKETRYVVVHGEFVELFKADADIRACYGSKYHDLQIFPIEVEV